MLPNDLDRLSPELRAQLTGPGTPFELTREKVRGTELTVFANRPRSLPAMLTRTAAQHPDRPYLAFPEVTVTYRATVEQAGRLAALLRDRYGVRPGDRIACVGANCPTYALTIWAAGWLGALTAGLNGWWTGPEMRHGLELSRPVLLVGDEKRLARLDGDTGIDVPTVTFDALAAELASFEGAPAEPDVDEDDPVTILFTSGTTGRPKGAVISHRAMINFAMDGQLRGTAEAMLSGSSGPPPDAPASLLVTPFFHISGIGPLLATAPSSGTTLVFPRQGRWDPLVHLDLSARYRVSQWSGVPTQFIRLLRDPHLDRYDLSALRTIGIGGAPLTTELTELFAAKVPQARPAMGYGMTETCGQGTNIAGARLIANPRSVGPASPTSEVQVRDYDGRVIDGSDPDEVGEIYLRTPSGFQGYWGDPAATAESLDADGWYRTGDFGRIVDGMLTLESRLRDMIIRGGENIYPIEIEDRLTEHPSVADAAVIGVPHDELGQEVLAVVVLTEGATLSEADVRAWVGEALARFKVPAYVRFADSLPYSATGKVLKRELEAHI